MQKKRDSGENELLRRRAIELIEVNPQISAIELSRQLGITPNTAQRWRRIYLQCGSQSLLNLQYGGKQRLTQQQLRDVRAILTEDATKYGFGDKIWTASKVKVLLHKRYQVSYQSTRGVLKFLTSRGIFLAPENKAQSKIAEFERLLKIIETKSPQDFGFEDSVWTIRTVYRIAHDELKIYYSANRIYIHLKRLGWSFKKYRKKALARRKIAE